MPIGCRLIAWVTMGMGFVLILIGAIGVVVLDEWVLRLAFIGVAAIGIGAMTYAEDLLGVW